MSRNGSGAYTPPASSFPAVAGTLIESTKYNNVINDLGAAITASIANDGQTPILANLPMGGFKFTGIGAGSNASDSAQFGQFNASSGASLVGFLQSGASATARTAQDKLREAISVKDFGAIGDGVADDTSAIQLAWDAANLAGGGAIHVPAGTYLLSSALVITGCDNVLFYGDGVDATILISNSTTANVFQDTGTAWWRTFRDFSITSSVTRTAGAYFSLTAEKRGLFDRLKLTGHFNGFNFIGFEQTEVRSCSVTTPTGAGTGIICGTAGAAGQGANLLINSCFIRGNNEVTAAAPIGLYGIAIYDVDAIFAMNTDIGSVLTHDLHIAPSNRSANHFFTQCFFDSTKNGNCVNMEGAGTKQQLAFTGSWMASAGKLTGGNAEACGVRALNVGAYQDIQFTGCKFYNCSGSGVLLEMPSADFTFTGCDVYANGAVATTNRYGIFIIPAAAQTVGATITGCKFSNSPNDLRLDANSGKNVVAGNNFTVGTSNIGAGNVFSGNYDNSIADVASATRLTINSNQSYVNVTGTTNIAGMDATFRGHIVALRFNGVLTVIDNSQNLRLAGNFTTAVDSVLTLFCDGAEWREIARTNT